MITIRSVIHVSLPKTMAGIRIIPMMPRVRDAFIEEREAHKKMGKKTMMIALAAVGFKNGDMAYNKWNTTIKNEYDDGGHESIKCGVIIGLTGCFTGTILTSLSSNHKRR